MQLKILWHRSKEMPAKAKIECSFKGEGKFVSISRDLFEGWLLFFQKNNTTSRFFSPLRYPGGKNRLAKLISKVCANNRIEEYVEPYAGGASVALSLLAENRVERITINDYDRSVYAFWFSVLNESERLCERIEQVNIDISSWRRAKEIQANKKEASLFELGFSTLFLNRTNISGILKAGLIGGIKQEGKYKMDCRFNKEKTTKTIMEIAAQRERITISNLDALELIEKLGGSANEKTLLYLDPPYYLKGASLYENHYGEAQHRALSQALKSLSNLHWMLSYDDTSEIRELYSWVRPERTKPYSLLHTAASPKKGKEILYYSESLTGNFP
jgi:DNA adenine methylase